MYTVSQLIREEPWFGTIETDDAEREDEAAVCDVVFSHGRYGVAGSRMDPAHAEDAAMLFVDDFVFPVLLWAEYCYTALPPPGVYRHVQLQMSAITHTSARNRYLKLVELTRPQAVSVFASGRWVDIYEWLMWLFVRASAFDSVLRVHVTVHSNDAVPVCVSRVLSRVSRWRRLLLFSISSDHGGGGVRRTVAGHGCMETTLPALDGCVQPLVYWCPRFHGAVRPELQHVFGAFVIGMSVLVPHLDSAVLEGVMRSMRAEECVYV